ncbi:hypothetical protein DEU56DRAFT_545632 [Suillus clintonianus]|uniref:uncharacterized protein n=1 Tax=Suillus clintonianus TaxID=1904413 RepID=UPI001B87BD91|nr:uncharacterized protein DEU56DRAFT_545632 [Suillus clintonianus]KAG2151316.1 hypothetical protein DEU56DRAFT_545632 [Suillus clintonianus]
MIKKTAVRAKQWQVDILKNMHAEEARPSASQRHKLAVETGLDEAWIRNWFMRKNRGSRAPMHPGGPLMHIIKLDRPKPDTPIHSDTSRSQGPASSHPVVSQGTSDTPPTLESLLVSVNRQSDKGYSMRTLAPNDALPHSVDPRSLSYTPDVRPALATRSNSSSYSSLEEESTLPQNTRKRRYSRDPLHNRYPDFSKFFLPTPSDTIGDAAKTPELPPIDMSSPIHNPSSINTALSPDFAPSAMQLHSPIAMPVFFFRKLIPLALHASARPSR